MKIASDETLMLNYAQGDFKAFEMLYERHKGPLFRYLSRQLHEQNIAEDIYQDTWGKVIASASRYKCSAKFNTWLYTIARNKVIDHIRHISLVNKVIPPFNNIDESVDENADADRQVSTRSEQVKAAIAMEPDTQLQQKEHKMAIEHCMQKLPKHQLDCFLLREEAGFSGQQIADVAQVTLEAAKSRLKVAYQQLRKCLAIQLDRDGQGISVTKPQAHGLNKEGDNEQSA